MRYYLLDANVVVPFYVEEDPKMRRRVSDLVARRAEEQAFLYLPEVCIPEVGRALARKCFQEMMFGPDRGEQRERFARLKDQFSRDLEDATVFYTVEVAARHIRLCNGLYEQACSRSFRKGSPPSAADLLLIAMGMDLARVHGHDRFAIVTAERPVYDLCTEDPAHLPKAFHLGERDIP